MALFLSTYNNKIDKKGRVSIPSQFRNALRGESFEGIVVYPSVINSCLEGCAFSRIEKLSNAIDSFDVLSEERDAFATSMLGASFQLAFDTEGRVILPKELSNSIELKDGAIFVGKGPTFEIWNPNEFAIHLKKSQKIAMEKRAALRFAKDNHNHTDKSCQS